MTRPIYETDTFVPNALIIPNTPVGPLGSGETYTGPWIEVYYWNAVVLTSKSDVDGTLYAEFSPDAANVDSTLTFDVTGSVGEGPHRLTITRRYFRVRYVNNGTAQSYWRLQAIAGNHSQLTSVLNSSIRLDADSALVRTLPPELELAKNSVTGILRNNKVGKNSAVTTAASATAPQFITEQGGFYTGFPINTLQPVRVQSTDVDDANGGAGAWKVRIIGLNGDWDVTSEEIPLNGTTAVESANQYRRIHTMFVTESGSATAANQGTITVNHATTTANIFCTILPNVGSSNYAVFTVPRNYNGIIFETGVELERSQTATIQGSYWIREFEKAPRFRQPFTASNNSPAFNKVYGGFTIPEKTDIALAITLASANNIIAIGRFDIILISTVL